LIFWLKILIVLLIPSAGGATPLKPWSVGFQAAATPTMEGLQGMHQLLLGILVTLGVLVTGLLGYTLWRFNEKRHAVPSQTSHNTIIEIVWTLVPVLILVVIGIPSLKLLFFSDKIENADLTIKATGRQWYWTYEFPDQKIEYDSRMIADADLKPGQLRLLDVDNPIVVPVGKAVRLLVTSDNVIHSFAVPSFGIKKDAIPGRLNETWFKVNKEGIYYGQCSELCGIKHGFMPIAVKVVSQAEFDAWVQQQSPPAHPQQSPS
jgi:cytochrome c oxidase subunit II